MKKRLRFSMPHVPLSSHRQSGVIEAESTSYGASNVGTMARIINKSNRKRKQHDSPPEGADGAVDSTDDEHSPLIQLSLPRM